MPNWLAAAHIDPFELISSLRTHMGLFAATDEGHLACPVRGPKVSAEGSPDPERFVVYSRAAKWPELTNVLSRIKRLGEQMGGIEYGRIDLEMLPAGNFMNWRYDPGKPRHEHAILMLRTTPAVTMFAGPEPFAPAIGWLNIVSRQVPRGAINLGDSPAIWLALDFKRKVPDA